MLVGNLDDELGTFYSLLDHDIWHAALDWISSNCSRPLEQFPNDGVYEIQGHDLRALMQTIVVKPENERFFESHRREIDLQCCLTGEDSIAWKPIKQLQAKTHYDEKKDVILYTVPESSFTRISLKPGDFAIFFPGDGHMPNLAGAGSRKVVIKIHKDLLTRP